MAAFLSRFLPANCSASGLFVLAVFGVLLTTLTLLALPAAPLDSALRDFDSFWLAGLLAYQGQSAAIYDSAVLGQQMAHYFQSVGSSQGFPYPPSSLLFFLPLPFLNPTSGLVVFMVASTLLVLAMAYKIARGLGVLLALGFAGLHLALDFGQLTPLITALLGLTLVQLAKRPAYAGLLTGLAVVKPHLALLMAVGLPAARQWRTVVSAGLVVISFIAASFYLLPGSWQNFVSFITQVLHIPLAVPDMAARFISPYFWLHASGAGKALALLGQALVSLWAVFIVWGVFANRTFADPLAHRLIAIGLLAPLAFPYMYAYDVCLNLLAVLGLARLAQARKLSWAEGVLVLIIYLLPLLSWLGYGGVLLTGVQIISSLAFVFIIPEWRGLARRSKPPHIQKI